MPREDAMRIKAAVRWTQRHFEYVAAQFALLAAVSLLVLVATA